MIFLLQIQEGSEPCDTKDEAPEDPGAGVQLCLEVNLPRDWRKGPEAI